MAPGEAVPPRCRAPHTEACQSRPTILLTSVRGYHRWWWRPRPPAFWVGARLTFCCAPRLGVAVACLEGASQHGGIAEDMLQTCSTAPGTPLPPKTPQARDLAQYLPELHHRSGEAEGPKSEVKSAEGNCTGWKSEVSLSATFIES
ncbi:hypothetical protein NDU88_006014 [Pleurodeles waltl]|uniref:Uncharacterized protein n=1 Tax=Pleurodeles waltl TaxID=8319 RepID=A0AAV7UMQ2_PLEWA|nr:hypothetical protein NDU88_006014 [Pleurodeles waltl]